MTEDAPRPVGLDEIAGLAEDLVSEPDLTVAPAGAYARRGVRATPARTPRPSQPVAERPPPHLLLVDTSAGRERFALPVSAGKARERFDVFAWHEQHGEPLIMGNVTVVSGLLLAPDGSELARFGAPPLDVDRPRWSELARVDAWAWPRCPACERYLWPFRIIERDTGRCRPCLVELEAADPRPSWGGEPPRPREWAKSVPSKHVKFSPLPG